jgi:enolase-phosphatase E1
MASEGVLLDIEGTTSSVRFVYDVLFPFARQHLADFLSRHWQEADVRQACDQIARDACAPSFAVWTREADADQARQQVIAEVQRLMDGDAKVTGLKQLQGLIWREGYASGQLCSHVYEDVPPALQQWRNAGLRVCIYSSGSVTAQKLFFAHTQAGDLTPLIQSYFDTTTGPKKEPASYTAIGQAMQMAPAAILFCSDVVAELDAAARAGLRTALSLRPENATVAPGHGHRTITSFVQLPLGPVAE